MTAWGVLSSVFLVGLLGGVHCAAMCGGLAMAIEQHQAPRIAQLRRVQPVRLWLETLVMHLGRIVTYALSGAVLGALGGTVWRQQWLPVQRGLFFAGGLLMCLYGVAILARMATGTQGRAWKLGGLERGWLKAAGRLSRCTPPVRWRAWLSRRPLVGRFATGLAWGLMPCGMLLGVLALALLAGDATGGAVIMLAFGLGTLPNLMAMSGLLGALRRVSRQNAWRLAGAGVVTTFGVLSVYRALVLPATLNAQGFCLLW